MLETPRFSDVSASRCRLRGGRRSPPCTARTVTAGADLPPARHPRQLLSQLYVADVLIVLGCWIGRLMQLLPGAAEDQRLGPLKFLIGHLPVAVQLADVAE